MVHLQWDHLEQLVLHVICVSLSLLLTVGGFISHGYSDSFELSWLIFVPYLLPICPNPSYYGVCVSIIINYILRICFQAMGGLVVLDVVGLLRGWRLFDHAGHLGGMLFGLWVGCFLQLLISSLTYLHFYHSSVYYKWLNEFLSKKRLLLVRLWRDFKSTVPRKI